MSSPLGQHPCDRHLCRRGADLVGNRLHLVDDPKVLVEVLEARVTPPEVALGELIDRA